jgi:hypothetical protein
MREWEDEEEE